MTSVESMRKGFKKDQLKVYINNFGKLRVSGEQPLTGNRWRRFREEFQVPNNCDMDKIRAKYENGLVYITLPKLKPEAPPREPARDQPGEAEPKPTQDSAAGKRNDDLNKEDTQKAEEEQKEEAKESEEAEAMKGEASAAREKQVASDGGKGGWEKWKVMVGGLGFEYYKPRKIVWGVVVAVGVVMVGIWYLYYSYKLKQPVELSHTLPEDY